MEGSAGTTGKAPVELSAVGPHLFGFSVCASSDFFPPSVCFVYFDLPLALKEAKICLETRGINKYHTGNIRSAYYAHNIQNYK